MNVTSSGIINGIIQPQYGGHGTQFNENHIPTFSLPFKVENIPEKTVSLAIVLEDKDAYPVTGGFAWIHWLAANITRFEIRDFPIDTGFFTASPVGPTANHQQGWWFVTLISDFVCTLKI